VKWSECQVREKSKKLKSSQARERIRTAMLSSPKQTACKYQTAQLVPSSH